MYTVFLTIAFVLTYLFLYFFFPGFFSLTRPKLGRRSLVSILVIVCVWLAVYFIVYSINNPAISNRLLHAIGGGALSSLICFLAARDLNLRITRFQFFALSFLVVMTLGIGNELVEFFLQEVLSFEFAKDLNDTWLDLLSNTIGAFVACSSFSFFLFRKRV